MIQTENKVKEEMQLLSEKVKQRISEAEKKATIIVDEAKINAEQEARKIIESAKKEAAAEAFKLRDQLRIEVSKLAIKGAEQILERQIDEKTHLDILKKLEAEL